MNQINLIFDGVGTGGWMSCPKEGLTVSPNINYLKRHYGLRSSFKDMEEVLLIEIVGSKIPGGAPMVYYQYLRYKGVKDTSNRPDSVFGVTIATDTFCPDHVKMFSICRDIFYNCAVKGGLLSYQQGNITWRHSNLGDDKAQQIFNAAEHRLTEILKAYNNNGMLLDESINGWHAQSSLSNDLESNLMKLNPSDVKEASLISYLKEGKKVAISYEYPTKNVCQVIDKAKAEQRETERHVAELKGELERERTEIERLRDKCKHSEKQQKRIQQLESSLKEVEDRHQQELKKFEAKGNYSCQQQLDTILAKLNHAQAATQNASVRTNLYRKMTLICVALILVIAAMVSVFVILWRPDASEADTENVNEVATEQRAQASHLNESVIGYKGEHAIQNTSTSDTHVTTIGIPENETLKSESDEAENNSSSMKLWEN